MDGNAYSLLSGRTISAAYSSPILITEEVKKDIKKLARERGYAADWKEFLLYRDSDKTGFMGYTNKSGTTYVKCKKDTYISN